MAEGKVEFELVSPERLLFSEPVDMVVIPGEEGDFGVLPLHTPMISNVRSGVIAVHNGGQISEQIFVAGGFAEVTPARCTVLAEQAMPVGEIDRAKAEEQLHDARQNLNSATSEHEQREASALIAIAEAMIAAAA